MEVVGASLEIPLMILIFLTKNVLVLVLTICDHTNFYIYYLIRFRTPNFYEVILDKDESESSITAVIQYLQIQDKILHNKRSKMRAGMPFFKMHQGDEFFCNLLSIEE